MRGAMLACIGIGRIACLDAIGARWLAVGHIGSRKGGAEGIYLQTRTGINPQFNLGTLLARRIRSGNFLKADTNAAHAELARLTALRVRQVTVARCGPGCPAGTEAQRTLFGIEFCDVPECEGRESVDGCNLRAEQTVTKP